MRLVARREWRPAAGRVVDWKPTEATLAAAAAAPKHPVGPSFLQRDHITAVAAARAEGRPHRAYTCAAVTVPGRFDESRMTEALTSFLRDHEALRSTFTISGGEISRHLVAAPDIELRAHTVDLGDHEIDAHVDRRLGTAAVFDAFPGVVFGAIVRHGSFDLYFGIDHAFGDGSSQAIGLGEILARYRGDGGYRAGSHLDHTADEYRRAAAISADSAEVEEWAQALEATGGRLPAFAGDLGLQDQQPQPVRIRRAQLADAEDTEAIAATARAGGANLTAAVYAALALTDQTLAGRDRYATATVLSTRGNAEHQLAQGWYCTFAPVSFTTRGTDIGSVLSDAAAGVARARRLARVPAHAVLGQLIATGRLDPTVLASPQMVSYLDFRWFPAQHDLADAVMFTGEGRTRNASLWISRDHEGLWIGSQCPNNPTAAQSVTGYFDTLRSHLATVVAAPVRKAGAA